MRNSLAFAALAVVSFAIMPMVASAQTFEKKNYNYSEWTKGRFSEALTGTGPGKMIFLAALGPRMRTARAEIFSKRPISSRSASMLSTRSSVRLKRTVPHLAILQRWSLI